MSRVLVTGAAGFVGAGLVKALLQGDHEVAVVVRSTTSLERLSEFLPRIRLVVSELEDDDLVLRLPWIPEACAHLAWYTEPSTYLNSPRNLRSLAASIKLMSALTDGGCVRYLVTGSCAEYDVAARPVTESDAIVPRTLYAASKVCLHALRDKGTELAGASLVWARLFNSYGPGESASRLIPAAIRALLGGRRFPTTSGEQIRDYLHIADISEALCRLLLSDARGPVNVSSGQGVSVRTVLGEIGRLTGRPDLIGLGMVARRESWDPPLLVGHNGRLRALTGWSPRHDLASGLEATVEWWRKVPGR